MLEITETAQGLVFYIFVQPKSSRNEIVGLHNNALKIRITAPPTDNAANKMCIAFLSKCFNVPKSAIDILSGHTARTKKILVRTDDDHERFAIREKLLANE